MIGVLLAALGASIAAPYGEALAIDTIPRVTLEQALQAAARLDPNYVSALGQIDDAEWVRRSAYSAFVLPSVTLSTSLTRANEPFFNVGTGALTSQIVSGQVNVSYNLFAGGAKLFEARRATARLRSAKANEVQSRFTTALQTESDYYDVLAQQELVRVGAERARRAAEQLAIARARVVSGAAVRTDSLQLLLELTRARVDLLRQEAALRVAQVQLGRRVGVAGPVDATPIGPDLPPPLPISEEEAVKEGLVKGPAVEQAVAEEAAASAAARAAYGVYLPQISLFGSWQGFDESFFPNATDRISYGFQINLPVWNNGEREIRLTRAKVSRDVARAVRRDTELGVRRDVIEAYQAYSTARASTELARQAVTVARENLDVQNTRYRAGATTILDLLTAQVAVSEAEAELVQARYATWLALAGLEAILGRRLFLDTR